MLHRYPYVRRTQEYRTFETAFHSYHPWPIIHVNENYENDCNSAEIYVICNIFVFVHGYLRNIRIIINHRDYTA